MYKILLDAHAKYLIFHESICTAPHGISMNAYHYDLISMLSCAGHNSHSVLHKVLCNITVQCTYESDSTLIVRISWPW